NPDPLVKLLDFGLGKLVDRTGPVAPGLTREGTMMGTCGYSAPEQMAGAAVDLRADVYALGAILYYLAAGRAPYSGETFPLLPARCAPPREPLDPEALARPEARDIEAIIHKAMSVEPGQRYADALQFRDELRRVLRPGDTFSDRPRARTSRLTSPSKPQPT